MSETPVRSGTTPWLDDEQQAAWRHFMAVWSLLTSHLDAQLQRDAGLGHPAYVVLAMLSEAPDRALRMTELAVLANMSPSRLSHAVSRLEDRGLVLRRPAPDDRRGSVASLTEQGYEVLVAAAPGHAAAVKAAVFGGFDAEDVRRFGDLLATVHQRLAAGSGRPTGRAAESAATAPGTPPPAGPGGPVA